MKKILPIALLLIVLMVTACEQNQVEESKESITSVVTAKVEVSSYVPELIYSGTVLATKEANLGTALPGRVEKIHFAKGDKVNKGDLIVELSDELLQQAEIEYKTYKKDFERMQRLYDKGSVAEMDYDHIKAQYEAKQENYLMVKKNTQIIAPFAGTITDYLVEEGENFIFNINLEPGYSQTSGIVRLMALDTVAIEFEAGSSEIAKIHEGQQATVLISSYPEYTFTGEIVECAPYLNQMTRTMTSRVNLSNKEGLLKPGMFAEVRIILPEEQGIFVPLQAIERVSGSGEDVVYVVKNNTVERRVIERIYTNGEDVAVSGVRTGEEIIINGKSKVKSGQTVQVTSRED